MNFIKKIAALALCLVMVLSVAGCHQKDEIAVTVGDVEFTSAYYMCALIYADTEARSKVDEELAEDEDASAEEVNYYKQKIDDKDFTDWVKDRAIESLKQIAAYKIKCVEAELELDEETAGYAEYYASYYWSSYGYSETFEPNGVSEETYTQYMKDSYYSSLYFEHVYGEGGEKEIAADEVSAALLENFVLVNQIDVDTSSMEEDEITSTKAQLETYANELTKGTRTFEEIYHEYNGTDAAEEHAEDTSDDTAQDAAEEETLEPIEPHGSILGSEDTDYADDNFETAKAMAAGEVKLIEKEDSAGYTLIVKLDIASDPYYIENLDMTVRYLLKQDEFEEDVNSYAEELETDINKYAVNQFEVKKIEYPESSY